MRHNFFARGALITAGLLCVLSAGAAKATTRTVTKAADTNDGVCDADCSLREAIGASLAGDSINFAPALSGGTITLIHDYGELVIGRNLSITGPSGGVTISHEESLLYGFRILHIIAGTVSLSHCTITHGYAGGPDGVSGTAANPNGNQGSDGFGGGIYNAGTLTMTNCAITSNSIEGGFGGDGYGGTTNYSEGGPGANGLGGGIYNEGTLTLINSSVTGNESFGGGGGFSYSVEGTALRSSPGGIGEGGGIYNKVGATLTLKGCTLAANLAQGGHGGGGIQQAYGSNGGSGVGGGLYSEGTTNLTNCTISNNTALGGAGGARGSQSTSVNGPDGSGGRGSGGGFAGYALDNSNYADYVLTLTNCTLSGNLAQGGAPGGSTGNTGFAYVGGLDGHGASSIKILNTIIAGNTFQGTQDTDTEPDVLRSFVSLGHNLIGAIDGSSGWVASDLTGTAAAPINPQLLPLADNGGPTQTHLLSASSVAINAGDDAVLSSPYNLTTDQRGLPRRLGTHVDIGASEFDPPQSGSSLQVTTTDEHNDGSCGTADCTLLEALNVVNANITANTITFKAGLSGIITTTQTNGLNIANTVTIKGPGTSTLAISGDNARRVFYVNASGSVSISGLTIAGGNADASSFSGNGGGILHSGSGALSLANCIFFANEAANYGGGIYNSGGALNVTNCSFGGGIGGNSATFGGGLFNATGAGTATLTTCTFTSNTAPSGGGAINNGSTVNATNCTFSTNTAPTGGGGAINSVGTTTLMGCTLNGNSAQNGGGGIYSYTNLAGHTTTLRNCTLSSNSAPAGGGALANVVGLTIMESCTLTGNIAPAGSGSGIVNSGNSNTRTEVTNSLIVGDTNSDVDYASGATNSFLSHGYNLIGSGNATAVFNATGDHTGMTAAQVKLGSLANNGGPTQTIALLSGSPAINAASSSAPATDQRGYARNGAPDIGAFEFGGVPPILVLNISPLLFSEAAGPNAARGTLARSGSRTAALTVNLSSSDTTEATVPSSVVIPAGAGYITFPIAAVDDNLIDGPQKVTILATAPGYTPDNPSVIVSDNEAHLGLTVSPQVFSEAGGTNAATGTVTRNTPTTYPLVVKIDNGDKHRLTVPLFVTIPAGQSSATFHIGVTDDTVAEGPVRIKLTARSKAYPTTSTTVTILDNEAKLTVTVTPSTFAASAAAGTVIGTVRRNTPATEALSVSLTSSNPGAAKVPSSVVIPAGATSANFPVIPVRGPGSTTITASATALGYAPGSTTVSVTSG